MDKSERLGDSSGKKKIGIGEAATGSNANKLVYSELLETFGDVADISATAIYDKLKGLGSFYLVRTINGDSWLETRAKEICNSALRTFLSLKNIHYNARGQIVKDTEKFSVSVCFRILTYDSQGNICDGYAAPFSFAGNGISTKQKRLWRKDVDKKKAHFGLPVSQRLIEKCDVKSNKLCDRMYELEEGYLFIDNKKAVLSFFDDDYEDNRPVASITSGQKAIRDRNQVLFVPIECNNGKTKTRIGYIQLTAYDNSVISISQENKSIDNEVLILLRSCAQQLLLLDKIDNLRSFTKLEALNSDLVFITDRVRSVGGNVLSDNSIIVKYKKEQPQG